MIEVELKAKLEKDEIPNFIYKLESLGFTKYSKMEEIDIYFNGIDRDFRKTDEALRIRKSINIDKKYINYYLGYKGPKMDNVSKTREEYEVIVNDGDILKIILEKLGSKSLPPITKIREIYKNNDIIVSLDNVEGVGYYVEFEKMIKSESEKKEALHELMNLIKSLNIDEDRLIKLSYLELRDKHAKK